MLAEKYKLLAICLLSAKPMPNEFGASEAFHETTLDNWENYYTALHQWHTDVAAVRVVFYDDPKFASSEFDAIVVGGCDYVEKAL